MTIPVYTSFDDKKKYFNLQVINTIEQFDELYQQHRESQGVYRGIISSQFKIFSSHQRAKLKGDNLLDYVKILRSNEYIQEYFSKSDYPLSNFSLYSLLQHYGKPTPLIDFTRNFDIALFFALDKIDISLSGKEVENYFTIFFICTDNLDLIDSSVQLRGLAKYIRESSIPLRSTYGDCTEEAIMTHTEEVERITNRKVFLLEYNPQYNGFIEIRNSHRVVMQEGAFIVNNYNEKGILPLEESLISFLEEEASLNKLSVWDDMDINRPDIRRKSEEYEQYIDIVQDSYRRLSRNIINSFEINKCLVEEIIKRYELPDKKLMYFDIAEILEEIDAKIG